MPIILFRDYSILGIFKDIAWMSFESLLRTWTNCLMNVKRVAVALSLIAYVICQYDTNIQNDFRILSHAPISPSSGSNLILKSSSLPSAVPSLIISLSSDSSRLVFSMLGSNWSTTTKLSYDLAASFYQGRIFVHILIHGDSSFSWY